MLPYIAAPWILWATWRKIAKVETLYLDISRRMVGAS